VWTKFLQGDQQHRDARLKLLPVVVDGPWIVGTAVGAGNSPALLGKMIPLQYYFKSPTDTQKGVYEVDVITTASRIAKGILNVVKGHLPQSSICMSNNSRHFIIGWLAGWQCSSMVIYGTLSGIKGLL
jgi:hypothetical protein